MRRRQATAPNAVVNAVVSYAPDPYGAGMAAALTGAIDAGLHSARAVVPTNPTWFGWSPPLQSFKGAAGLGSARALAERNSELSKENTAQITDPVLRQLAARSGRGLS